MRVRTRMVSNSSSSSFCCQVCGTTESGWDASPKDFGMVECQAGHIICESHITGNIDYSEDDDDSYYLSKKRCPICTLSVVPRGEMFKYLCKKHNITPAEVENDIRTNFECRADFLNYIKDR